MPSVSAYLDRFAEFLEQHLAPFVAEPSITVDTWDEDGVLDGIILFPDHCELHVALAVNSTRIGAEEWARYAFHCQDQAGRCVVRLDNAPHHRWVSTLPHHIHRGPDETVGAYPAPTGRDVVREMLSYHDGHGLLAVRAYSSANS